MGFAVLLDLRRRHDHESRGEGIGNRSGRMKRPGGNSSRGGPSRARVDDVAAFDVRAAAAEGLIADLDNIRGGLLVADPSHSDGPSLLSFEVSDGPRRAVARIDQGGLDAPLLEDIDGAVDGISLSDAAEVESDT